MKLYLIRHGKTAANERRLYCGSTDLPLSAAGAAELRQLHYRVPADCVFLTSGMKRTEQTLELLFGAVPHRPDPSFREVDFGAFEMRSYEQLKTDPAYQAWIAGDNESNVPPGGESGSAMRLRVCEALEALVAADRDTVLICHGGTVAIVMDRLFPAQHRSRYEWQPKPGCGYLVEGGSFTPIP